MLPNLGYFRSINCPEKEKCHRPYCPFRHQQKATTSTQDQINEVNEAINKLKSEINDSTIVDNNGNNNTDYVPFKPYQTSAELYKPFSDKQGTSKEIDHSEIFQKTSKKFNLKGAQGPSHNIQVYKPKYEKVKPVKYQVTRKTASRNDLEYDPMSNYNVKEMLNQESLKDDQESQDDEELPSSDLIIIDDDATTDDITTDDVTASDVTASDVTTSDVTSCEEKFSSAENSSQDETNEKVPILKIEKIRKSEENKQTKTNLGKKRKEISSTGSPKSKKLKKDKLVTKKIDKNSYNSKTKKLAKITSPIKHKKDLNQNNKNREKKKTIAKVKEKEKIEKKPQKSEEICNFDQEAELKSLEKEMDEVSTYEECLQIFQVGVESNKKPGVKEIIKKPKKIEAKTLEQEEVVQIVQKNKRIAHQNTEAPAQRAPRKARKFLTPAQAMMARVAQAKREKLNGTHSSSSSLNKNFLGKSNVQRKPFQDLASTSATKQTAQGTALKGFGRVSHSANKVQVKGETIELPRIHPDRHSKVPTNIRQKFLMRFIMECLRINNKDKRKAYKMAVEEENVCKTRSKTKNIYLSLAASALKRLMSTKVGETPTGKSPSTPTTLTANNHKGSYTIIPKEKAKDLTNEDLYNEMVKYLLTEEELIENGFPRPGDSPGVCIFKDDIKVAKPSINKKCCRCGKEFVLFKNGEFEVEAECKYHWGRAYMTKVGSDREKIYSCCQNPIWSEGCSIGPTHVHSDNKLDNSAYFKTLEKSPTGESPRIVSFDCEMCYTVNGLELARVSVVDVNEKLVYDTFVKPSGRVLDYNTRWSGITEEDLVGVTTNLREVQTRFLTKFSSETIFIGHSLESDLVALRLIHSNVVDTSVVFPHKLGPPYKRALRNLMSDHLGIIIQNAGDEGHDSTEDASSCIKLMKWKVNGQKSLF